MDAYILKLCLILSNLSTTCNLSSIHIAGHNELTWILLWSLRNFIRFLLTCFAIPAGSRRMNYTEKKNRFHRNKIFLMPSLFCFSDQKLYYLDRWYQVDICKSFKDLSGCLNTFLQKDFPTQGKPEVVELFYYCFRAWICNFQISRSCFLHLIKNRLIEII